MSNPEYIKKQLEEIENSWGLALGKHGRTFTKTPAARGAFDQVLYLVNTVRGLYSELETLQQIVDGASLCAAEECGMHCGLGHLRGCAAVKAYLRDAERNGE